MQSYNRLLVVSSISFVTIIIIGFIGFSSILQFVVRDQTALRRRNMMRKFYLKIPIPLDFRVYFFNISNPFEVQRGKMPILKEVGPYCYDSYKEKIDLLENEGEDSLTYTPYETYFFNQQRSGDLTQDDYVTVLHPLIVGIVNTVAKDSPPLLPIVNNAIKSIFNKPQNVYITTKVRDFLFDGITINCNISGFSGSAVCTQIKTQVADLIEVGKNVYKFSILGSRNGTLPNRFKILRGIKKSQELGRLVELNHEKESNKWPSKRCNRFEGTDGWIFPPFVNKDVGLSSYSSDLCRSVHITYVDSLKVHGISLDRYYADLGDMSTNPEEKCFCPSPKNCLPKGVMDMTKCMGVPIYATLPHFLRVDEALQKTVQGLNPITEKHIVRVLIEPLLAVPLEAHKRLQFNLPIRPLKKIDLMKTMPVALHPIFWIEEGIILEGSLLKLIKSVFIALKVFAVVKYCILALSIVGAVAGGYKHYRNKQLGKVTPLNLNENVSKPSDEIIKSEANSAKEGTNNIVNVNSEDDKIKF